MRTKKFSQTSYAAANGFIIVAGEDTRLLTLDAIRPVGSSDDVARAYKVVVAFLRSHLALLKSRLRSEHNHLGCGGPAGIFPADQRSTATRQDARSPHRLEPAPPAYCPALKRSSTVLDSF